MKKTLCKSTLALAVAVASTGAYAGDLDRDAPFSAYPPYVAEEIFGPGSAETLITVPDATFTLTQTTGNIDVGQEITFKITLLDEAVFGEDLSDIDDWADSDLTLIFYMSSEGALDVGNASAPLDLDGTTNPGWDVEVTSGGAIGDNTVTFTVYNDDADDELESVNFGYFKIKNVHDLLAPVAPQYSPNGEVSLVAEFQNDTSGFEEDETAPALEVLSSDTAWEIVTYDVTGYSAANTTNGGKRGAVAATSGNTLFSGPTFDFSNGNDGAQGLNDFFGGDDTDELTLAQAQVVPYNNGFNSGLITKEDLTPFAFNGADDIDLVMTAMGSTFAAYDQIYFTTPGNECDAGSDFAWGSSNTGEVTINVTGSDASLIEDVFWVCMEADGVTVLPLEENFNLQLGPVDYSNIRYIDSTYNDVDLGGLSDNGCSVTLFNVPNPTSGDTAFIRLTNITDVGGRVYADMWREDGTQMAGSGNLTEYLDAHATAVYTSDPSAPGSSVYLGTGVPDFDAETTGRSRILLQGSFPTCEAMGLVRSPNGTLTNMTSTTYNGPDYFFFSNPAYGNDTNGTSNTPN